jgi:hypothetical protein
MTEEHNTEENSTGENTQTKGSRMTEVKTIYARIAILLLTLNFCLTGYVTVKLSELQQEASSSIQGVTIESLSSKREKTPAPEGGGAALGTREKENE